MIDPSTPSEITNTNKAFVPPPNENVAKAPHAQLDRPQPPNAMNTTVRSDADQVTSSLASQQSIEVTVVNPIPTSSDLPRVEERKQGNGGKSSPTSITPSIITPPPSYFGTLFHEENGETLDSERCRRRQEFAKKRRRHTKATSLQAHYDDILSQVDAALQNQQNNNMNGLTSTRNLPTSVERHYLPMGMDLLAEMEDEEEISDDEAE